MFRRTIAALAAAVLCIGCGAVCAGAAEVESGSIYCFSPTDFSEEETITGICITELPENGCVMLNSRILCPGDILTADQVAQMIFAPANTEVDGAAEVGYLPVYGSRVAEEAQMTISIRGKEDKAPVAEDFAIETYKNLPNTAKLKAEDPEGQPMTYTVTRAPKRGDVVIREDGSFIYTPRKNKVGIDSFAYTATDPAGNVSREATVTIQVIKPSDAKQYTDTVGKNCRFAAEWMKNTGIFVGESFNGNGCFRPEKQVSRGDFLTMLVGALEIPVEEDAVSTGFSDECADWLKPYLAAAMRAGLTVGWPRGDVFGAEEPITGAEAAVMLQNALDLTVDAVSRDEAVPVWAREAVGALESHGIELDAGSALTRGEAANIMYRIHGMKGEAPGLRAIRAAQ